MRFTSIGIAAAACAAAGCGQEPELAEPAPARCPGLEVELVQQMSAPPANVAALVRVSKCGGATLEATLSEDNFELAEDGEALSPFEAARHIQPTERAISELTILTLDLSGSVTQAGLRASMVEGARRLALQLIPGHRIAVFGFDGRPDLVPYVYFTSDEPTLLAAFDRVQGEPVIDDSTNLHGAVVSSLAVLDEAVRAEARDVYRIAHGSLVLFTDGTDRAHRASRGEALAAAKASSHAIYTIGLGAEIDAGMLDAVGRTASLVAGDGAELVAAFESVAAEVRARARRDYVIGYCSPSRKGSHELRIDVRSGDLTGSAALDFDAAGFGAGCNPAASLLH
jgi:hypothetical protein